MAAKRDESLQPEIGRDLCRVRTEGGKYRGYKKDILTENLSERDNAVFVCPRCQGILRELCLSTDGEQFCSCCKKEEEHTHTNIHMNNMVLSFKCTCPLNARGCGWLGTVGDCENHLDTCGYVQETCKLKCGFVLQRNDLVTHEKENCVQRIVNCKHCKKNFKFRELTKHLKMCPKVKVSCELKCGIVMCRDKVAQHLKKECGKVEEDCKLGCGVKLTRDELIIHVTDKCVQRLIVCEHCKENFIFRDMPKHLDMCPKMKVSCELKCGFVMCRDKVTQHIDRDCKEKEIECPFVKYKCVGLIKRQNLSKHLEEKETEHLKLKVNAIEDIVMKQSELIEKLEEKETEHLKLTLNAIEDIVMKQGELIEKFNERITDQGEVIEKQNAKIGKMSQEFGVLTTSKRLLEYYPIKFNWQIKENRNFQQPFQKEFDAMGYLIQFNLSKHKHDSSLLLDFCLKDGLEYDKLDWPFRAKFITHYSSNRFGNGELKSEVIEVQRGDLASNFCIATIPYAYNSFPFSICTDLEISVIFC